MKILHCNEYGPIENLEWVDIDSPIPNDDEVLITVKAAAAALTVIKTSSSFGIGESISTHSRFSIGPYSLQCSIFI